MATATKKTRFEKSLNSKWRDNYKPDTKFFKNQEEYKKVGELQEKLEEHKMAFHSNCYWGADGGMHTSWGDRADYLSKIVNMWHAAVDPEDPRPNLKSTFAYNAVETAMTELHDLNLSPAVLPWTKKGQKYAPITENIIKYPIIRHSFQNEWLDAMQEALWLGNSFLKVQYTKIKKVRKFKKLKDFNKKELDLLEKGEEIAIYVDKEYVEYNDVDWIHIPFQEYFPDPSARRQHGRNFAAQHGIWERTISYDSFIAEFGGRREFKNIDKVKAADNQPDGHTNPLFSFPKNMKDTDSVVVQEWENRPGDFTRYVANGIWLGDIPLANHKQLSVVHIGAIKLPHQYYYMGLADALEGLQTEDEVIRNKFLELLELSLTPPIIANNQVAGEFKDQYETAKYNVGDIISISGKPSEVQWMAPAISRLSEVYGLRTQIREDVISVSLIDPKASAMPTNTPTAFEAMQMTAATMKSFMKTLKTFSRGIQKGLQIQWALQKQEYPLTLEPEAAAARKGDKKDQVKMLKSRTIFTQDVLIVEDGDQIETKKFPGKVFPFEIKDEYLDLEDDDMDIIISPESQIPMSKVAKVKKSEEALAQLFPIYAQDAQIKGIAPMDYEPIQFLLKDYLITHDQNLEQLGSEEEAEEDARKRAKDQHQQMQLNAKLEDNDPKFKIVMGEYGEPLAHRNEHLKAIVTIKTIRENKEADLEELRADSTELMLAGKPATAPMLKKGPQLIKDIMVLEKFEEQLRSHYEIDRMSALEGEEMELAQQAGYDPGQMTAGAPMASGAPNPAQLGQMGAAAGSPPSVPAPAPTGAGDIAAGVMV